MTSVVRKLGQETAPKTEKEERFPAFRRRGVRYALIAFGWLNVALGAIGVVVPGMPTTIFLLIALWAFSNSSERFRVWLYNHKTFGPHLRAWREHRAIPLKAKILAVSVMASSITILAVFVAESAMPPLIAAAILLPIAGFIVTRPNGPVNRLSS